MASGSMTILTGIDVNAVHRFLSQESYWARGGTRETVQQLVRAASRVVGPYRDGQQVGFARAVTDGVSFAYLADVDVLAEFRLTGMGIALVREMVEHGPFAAQRWLLHTADAHALYERVGFARPPDSAMERPRDG